jgi:DNA polymerase-2
MNSGINGFLLTRQWQDTECGILLNLWFSTSSGPVNVIIDRQQAIFFIRQEDEQQVRQILSSLSGWSIKQLQLKNMKHEPVSGLYFQQQHKVYQAKDWLSQNHIDCYEADIRPVERFLTERFLTGSVLIKPAEHEHDQPVLLNPGLQPGSYEPQFKVISLDIETAYDTQALFSISLLAEDWKVTLMISTDNDLQAVEHCEVFATEGALMQRFIALIQMHDPDIIIGWNVVNFDFRFLQQKADRLNLRFEIGRGASVPNWRKVNSQQSHYFMQIPGRVVLDGIDTLKSATWNFESFSLDFVANELLKRGKLIKSHQKEGASRQYDPLYKAKEIKRQFHEDKESLAAYNMEDCQLVWDIFKTADLINFAIERTKLTGLEMDRSGGSVAAFDNLYLPRLHRKGYVASQVNGQEQAGAPGGYVMDSKPGLYDSVLVLDYKSLYPSIIRTFKVDPYARTFAETLASEYCIPGFKGISFAKKDAILPDIIESLWTARDKAKRGANKALSQAIKIIMNSFYGVLGTPGCRLHDARLTSSITMRGHEIIKETVRLIESYGYEVIYGDTDSVFVSLGSAESCQKADEVGKFLVDIINKYWQDQLNQRFKIESRLEMEYETHFKRFFMPTIRGSDKGSKKRYAGLLAANDKTDTIIYKGLESVRTDWTHLARDIQQALYQRVFLGQAYDDYLRSVVTALKQGELDHKLVYRKRLRQKLADYKKNIPPHAQAAIKAANYAAEQGHQAGRYKNGGWIEYVMTTSGPEPVEYNQQPLDYQHYMDKQIAPVVDTLLIIFNQSLEKVIQDQYELF